MQLRLNKCWFKLLLFAVYVLIIGCSNKDDMAFFSRCISADYFGPKPITISAHFSKNHDAFIPEDQKVIDPKTNGINYDFHLNQVIKWKDTGFETNGDSLVVRVKGAWTSMRSNNFKRESQSSYSLLKDLEKQKYEAKFEGKQRFSSLIDFHLICNDYKSNSSQKTLNNLNPSCNINCKSLSKDDIEEKHDSPFWFTNGYGAYLLFKRPNDPNPNENLKYIRNPESPTIHLGHSSITEGGSGLFILDRDSAKLKDKNYDIVKLKKGWKIYVKILDKYYLNNVGGYSFEFLSGVQQPNTFGFFDYVYNYLKCILLINENCTEHFDNNDPAAAQAMFQNIAEKSKSFHNFVLSLLVLFILVSSLLYLLGMVQQTKHDILIRMIKITLVVILISPRSFKFFYDHFLILLIKGFEQLISNVTNFAPNSNSDKLFGFMEEIFNKFFTYSVLNKFIAFFHYQMWTSVFMIPAIFIGIILYFLLCIYAYIIFLSGFIGIAFLIATMPLFFISILFSMLKNLFEGWIKFCISFCLQSIMIFTLLSLFAGMIMNTFYRQLGFSVCYNKWLEIKLCSSKAFLKNFCIIDKKYFSWTPGQIFVPYTIGEASKLNLDKSIEDIDSLNRVGGTVKFTGGAGYIPLPPNYLQKGFRYIDYPFFNPIPDTNDNSASHYIAESDILVNKDCTKKDLVRLTNSLLHATKKADILLLIDSIDKRIDGASIDEIVKRHCQDVNKCNNYKKIINEIKALVQNIITKSISCKLENFHDINKNYHENSDYQRIQNIQKGYLINIGEIFVLFLLSFLMFSLKEFVQQMGSSIAGGGFSVYTISSMYQASPINSLMQGLKQNMQNKIGKELESLGNWTNHVPYRLVGGTANLLGRIPRIGDMLKFALKKPRTLVGATIETTKFVTSPKNDCDKLEEKMYNLFEVNKEDIIHKRIGKYFKYYKGYVGSNLGYTIKDAIKFTWKYSLDYIRTNSATGKKDDYTDNLLYRIKEYRQKFLKKLYEYTIGRRKNKKR